MKYNNVDYYIKTASGGYPVSLAELKRHLNLSFETSGSYDFTDDDQYLNGLIVTATSFVESYTGQSIRKVNIVAEVMNECGNVALPRCPFDSIVTAVDEDGNDVVSQLDLSPGIYPAIRTAFSGVFTIEYVAGWYALGNDSYSKLPEELKQAILEEAAWRYRNRGTENSGLGSEQAKALMANHVKKSWLT